MAVGELLRDCGNAAAEVIVTAVEEILRHAGPAEHNQLVVSCVRVVPWLEIGRKRQGKACTIHVTAEQFFPILCLCVESGVEEVLLAALRCMHALFAANQVLPRPDNDPEDMDWFCVVRSLRDHSSVRVQRVLVSIMRAAFEAPAFHISGPSLALCIELCISLYVKGDKNLRESVAEALIVITTGTLNRMESNRPSTPVAPHQHPCTLDSFVRQLLYEIVDDVDMIKSSESLNESNLVEFRDHSYVGAGMREKRKRNAFIVFRVLCDAAMTTIPDGTPATDARMEGKVMVLDLIHNLLEKAGPIFRSFYGLTYALKRYLCLAVLRNCVSQNVLELKGSLLILRSLINNFKEQLKVEIGVFFSSVFLRILESPSSSYSHTLSLLQEILKFSQTPQNVIDMFLYYDCEIDALDIFERMVNVLSRISQGSHNHTDLVTRMLALECLVGFCLALRVETSHGRTISLSSSELNLIADTLAREHRAAASHSPPPSLSIPEHARADSPQGLSPGARALRKFEERQQRKQVVSSAITRFNTSASKGIHQLRESLPEYNTPRRVAHWLRTTLGLSKSSLGDYLGDPDPFAASVLDEFVSMMDFREQSFDVSLRYMMTEFWLPGESQKIERIMNAFASNYCKQNVAIFSAPDTAFVLAYSLIMLNTNLHNPNVQEKDRMALDAFLVMNRGIDAGADLPAELLTMLYASIKGSEIKMRAEDHRAESPSGGGPKGKGMHRKQRSMAQELLDPRKKHAAFMEGVLTSGPHLEVPTKEEVVRPMFELAWCPLLAAFSVMLESTTDSKCVSLCLDGFKCAINIAHHFHMEIERNAFLTSLDKFSTRYGGELREKNMHLTPTPAGGASGGGASAGASGGATASGDSGDEEDEDDAGAEGSPAKSIMQLVRSAGQTDDVLSAVEAVTTSVAEGVAADKISSIQKMFVGNVEMLKGKGRVFVRDGPLIKMCRKQPKWRWFFLFNDVLVYAIKLPNTHLFSYRKMIHLSYTRLAPLQDTEMVQNAFQIISPEKSFTVAAATPEGKASWMFDIKRSIQGARAMRDRSRAAKRGVTWSRTASVVLDRSIINQTFREMEEAERKRAAAEAAGSDAGVDRAVEGAAVVEEEEEEEGGTVATEEEWDPMATEACMECSNRFSFARRRNLCSQCGRVVCKSCTQKVSLRDMGSKSVRVCKRCAEELKK